MSAVRPFEMHTRIAWQNVLKASAWYIGTPEAEKKFLRFAIRQAADYVEFGFCCVLDGVRVIESTNPKPEFRLIAVTGDGTEVPRVMWTRYTVLHLSAQ